MILKPSSKVNLLSSTIDFFTIQRVTAIAKRARNLRPVNPNISECRSPNIGSKSDRGKYGTNTGNVQRIHEPLVQNCGKRSRQPSCPRLHGGREKNGKRENISIQGEQSFESIDCMCPTNTVRTTKNGGDSQVIPSIYFLFMRARNYTTPSHRIVFVKNIDLISIAVCFWASSVRALKRLFWGFVLYAGIPYFLTI